MTATPTFALPGLSDRIEHLATDAAALRDSMTSRKAAVEGLDALPARAAADKLHAHLRDVFIPDTESLAAAQRILETGWGYAVRAYPNIGQYICVSSSDSNSWDSEPPTWILTGLAGMSKTATVQALERVLLPDLTFQASVHTPLRILRGGVFLKVLGKATNKTMTAQLRKKLDMPELGGREGPRDLDDIRRELYRQGCLFLVIDESQAIANGALAGAAFVNLIVHMRRFGVPVIVVGNYSMCHGILAQNSQIRQRVASDPLEMPPDQAHDLDYQARLQAYVDACGGVLDIKPLQDAKRICELTGGGSRALLTLVCSAYVDARNDAREGGSVTVNLVGLERAYGSAGYSNFREEIEELRKCALHPKELRKDLRSPFVSIGDAAMTAKRAANEEFAERLAREKLLASMSVAEHRAISNGELEPPSAVGSVRPAPYPTAATAASVPKPMIEPIRKSAPVRPRGAKRPPPTLQDALRTRDAF